jgi:hypothetical protein
MLSKNFIASFKELGRSLAVAHPGDPKLGPLAMLPGKWANLPKLAGHGWNMIALPFAGGSDFRLLLNQFNEELEFSLVDTGVPNRGIKINGQTVADDQFLVALDYKQKITQVKGIDFPASNLVAPNGTVIHVEPGLWLNMGSPEAENTPPDGLDLARLATIPHGDSVLALGKSVPPINGAPTIPDISGLPIGVDPNIDTDPYLAPYKNFHQNKFEGVFDPVSPNDLLKAANQGVNIVSTTVLHVDTAVPTGGIVNIPFIAKQAAATQMEATFWIQELAEKDAAGKPRMRLQYSQTVFLEFFSRPDGQGLIRWPHVSINTMEKVV